jgi:hypothetical protein
MKAGILPADKAFDADKRVIEPLLKNLRDPAKEEPQNQTQLRQRDV